MALGLATAGQQSNKQLAATGKVNIKERNMIFDKLGNMGDMINQAREIQKNLKTAREELQKEEFEGECEGIRIRVNGEMEVKKVTIDPSRVDSTRVSKLEELVKEAANRALSTSRDAAGKKLRKMTGGLNIPGLT